MQERNPAAVSQDRMRPRDERLTATYEHVSAGIVEVDEQGRMLRVNQELCRLTGYAATELVGRTIFQETLPEDVEFDRKQFQRQLCGELDRYTIEKRIYRSNGEHFWAEVGSSCVRDADGKFLYAVRVQHDITERKRAEQSLARRMNEQAALFEFSDRLQHVRSLEEISEAALDAIIRALDCDRASILLFDSSDVMRFVAWRGLSDHYRRAVEGHSPWSREHSRPPPIYFEDIASSDLSDSLKQTIAGEGIGAVAFIPIVDSGDLAGKFMAYYDRPRRFADQEVDVALDSVAPARIQHRTPEGGAGASSGRAGRPAAGFDR